MFGIAAGPPIYLRCSGDLVLRLFPIWRGTYISSSTPLERRCEGCDQIACSIGERTADI